LLNVGNGDVNNLKLTLVQGHAVTGKVSIDGAAGVELPRGFVVTLAREPDVVGVPGPQGRGAVQPNGTFTLANVPPGDYRIYVAPYLTGFQWNSAPVPQQLQNGFVKAVGLAGRDVLSDGLLVSENAPPGEIQIVLASGGRLTGLAVNDRREPLANATVALVPALALRRRTDLYRSATTDISGRFQMQGIAPGTYSAYAWEQVARDAWQNGDFMRSIEGRGTQVQIREGMESSTEVVVLR
jgi:hypothetical protein